MVFRWCHEGFRSDRDGSRGGLGNLHDKNFRGCARIFKRGSHWRSARDLNGCKKDIQSVPATVAQKF